MSDLLQQIRDLQFVDKTRAEALLLSFLNDIYPQEVTSVELRPLAVSLNSFNGFMTLADGQRYFFKTHTESDTVIHEYYNSSLLADAGYPIIQPVFQSTEPGKQILVYRIVDSPSVFDSAWKVESFGGDYSQIAHLQAECDKNLFKIYLDTMHSISPQENHDAPVHQLFFHRLTRGRLQKFYGDGAEIHLPGSKYPMSDVLSWIWEINGQLYSENLQQIIARAIQLLNPDRSTVAVIGHGDAHNGNIFLEELQLVYFDPAFAGRHNPILDLVKPLFHNVFAMWMYFPEEKTQALKISMKLENQICRVEHSYSIHPIREMFFRSKIDHVLIPLLKHLRSQSVLEADWRSFLKAALFCCPFLTMNLADHERFNRQIALLGIAMAVEMGSESAGRKSLIDATLDTIEDALR